MLDGGVGTGEEEGFVPAVPPPNDMGRRSVRTPNLEHFAVAIGLTRLVPVGTATRSPTVACIASSFDRVGFTSMVGRSFPAR